MKSLIHSIKCETERNAIGLALDKTGWNRKAAARLLKVSYRTLLYKIDQYQMTSSETVLFQRESFFSGNRQGQWKSKLISTMRSTGVKQLIIRTRS